jgi:Spy/CpxP family protein refolding chaperone
MKLTLFLCAMAVGFAQTPTQVNPAAPPSTDVKAVGAVKGYVALTDAQVAQLSAIHQNEMRAVEPIQAELATKEQALSNALENGSTDTFALGALLLDIASFRKQIDAARQEAVAQGNGILTGDQKAKVAALDAASNLDDEIRGATMLSLIRGPVRSIPGGRGTGSGGPGRPAPSN